MKGFILAAGFGERLRPVSETIPKPLMPVVNVPAICYAVMLLKEAGIHEIIINLHYRPRDIVEFFSRHDNFGCAVTFSHEDTILGTGGGVKNCEHLLKDDFILINSDIIIDAPLPDIVEYHRHNSAPGTVVLRRTPESGAAGPVSVDGDRVVDFKNFLGTGRPAGYEYTGLAVLSPQVLQYLENDFSSIVYTGYTGLITGGKLLYYEHQGFWRDIGSLESYREANMEVFREADVFRSRMWTACGLEPGALARDALCAASADIKGSVIGQGARIGERARVISSVALPGSVVEDGEVIENAVVYGREILHAGDSGNA